MEKLIDMHIHSNYSDGEFNPNELITMANDVGIKTMAITDHDSINGIKQIDWGQDIIKNGDIEVYNGIELSAKVTKGCMHILGYDFDVNNAELNDKMSELRDNSLSSVLSNMEQIKRDFGIRFKYDDIRDLINANHNLGRPDLARLCVKYGYAKSCDEAFEKYLEPAYETVKKLGCRKGITYQECISLIKNSNGIPVLAHPKTLKLNNTELCKLLENMIDSGLLGIEVYHSSHNEEEIKFYLELAKKYNLLVSGGSDYHGPNTKSNIKLGTGEGNLKIKRLSLVDELRRRRI